MDERNAKNTERKPKQIQVLRNDVYYVHEIIGGKKSGIT